MEKVIIESGYSVGRSEENEVNKYLDEGWKVKFVTTAATEDRMSVIFVLEK